MEEERRALVERREETQEERGVDIMGLDNVEGEAKGDSQLEHRRASSGGGDAGKKRWGCQ